MPKVKFGLKNVYYALLTINDDGSVSFGVPVHIPGAVSMSLSPRGDTETFYADDIAYYIATANNGYQGNLEIAVIPDSFRKDVMGDVEDATDSVLVENSMSEPKPFALLYEVGNDVKPTRGLFYNCSAARPSENNTTVSNTKTPNTETLTLTVAPLADGRVKAKTTEATPDAVYNGWFEQVWQPAAAAGV